MDSFTFKYHIYATMVITIEKSVPCLCNRFISIDFKNCISCSYSIIQYFVISQVGAFINASYIINLNLEKMQQRLFEVCIVLYYEALYWRPIRPLSYRHSPGVVGNPHSTLVEWGIFNLRSMSPLGTHLLIARRCNSITSGLVIISWMTCLCATWASNHQPFDYWRAHRVYYVASQPRTSDRLISRWRVLCLLAHDNWRCSIQPETFHTSKFCSSRDSISDRQLESQVC